MKSILLVSLLNVLLISPSILAQEEAQSGAQYRGFWVDTFNTALNHHNDVLAVVNNAKAARGNALFVQVRRRGDAWYRNSLEPLADRTPIAAGFDPLGDLIQEAHAAGLEVHAFVVIYAIWNRPPPAALPESPNHVFNKHGFNQATGRLYEGRDNWLTRTLLADDGANISFNGHRFGNEFALDLGHPDAAQYTHDVLLHLVRNYDLDGLHLDRIRYPELSVAGQTPASGVNIGYNEISVARFQKRYGLVPGSAPPAPNDANWSQWRRAQVTNFVRRVYLSALAVKPKLKISAALIAFGGGPATEAAWQAAESYWRVYQDWRAWTEEGILDLAIPMNYKREHQTAQVSAFETWNEWTKNHAYDRAVLLGLGVYLNSLEGTLRQLRRALAPSGSGQRNSGAVFFSAANTNEAVAANLLSIPAGLDTPRRSFDEFAAALTTGRSVNGATAYEDQTANPTAVFAQPAPVPVLPWKANPQTGHLMGVVKTTSGEIVDTGEVLIARVTDDLPPRGRVNIRTATDGNGFYGGVDLAPGRYRVTISPVNEPPYTADQTITIVAGLVSQFDLFLPRGDAPRTLASVSAASFAGPTLAPETIVSGFGAALTTATATANSLPLPTNLAGASVRVKDSAGAERLAPLFFVSPGQINYLLPPGSASGLATVSTFNGENKTSAGAINIDRVAPGLFAANANGQGVAAALALRVKADGSQVVESVAQFDAAQNRFVPRPLAPPLAGEEIFLALFGTGLRGRTALNAVTARIGNVPAEVLYAGAQGELAGLDQANLRLPRAVHGLLDVLLFVDNRPTNAVQISVLGF
jgi:uncharacterized protein (TIGR03437 family)